MMDAPSIEFMADQQSDRISRAIRSEQPRLRNFIRKHVADESDAEDILQDVFYEFVQAYRLMKPVEQAGAWLFRVARNRIIDLFRKKRPTPASQLVATGEEGDEEFSLENLLPSPDAGPDAAFARGVLIEELDAALDDLPEEQRRVFVAHELEGTSFKDMARATGLSVNTLLSRKHYAVLYLRRRLQAIHDEFTKG
jgi:RNA polymerase sigma factor (sigma-70 family)